MNIRRYANLIVRLCIYGALVAFTWSLFGITDPLTIFVIVFPLVGLIARYYFYRRNPISYYNFMLKLKPWSSVSYHNRGYAYLRRKEYHLALQDFDRFLTRKPKRAIGYYHRGLAYFGLNEYRSAIQDFDRAITLTPADPKYALAYNYRGMAHHSLRENQLALQDYNRALDLDPQLVVAYCNRGFTHFRLKENQFALQDCNHAIELDARFGCAYDNRGKVYLVLDDMQQAYADFVRAWELDPTHIMHGWKVEWARMCQEKPNREVAERLERIASIDPQHFVAYLCRGVALWIRGNSGQALAELEQALVLGPKEWDAYFWKGMIYASLKRDEEAVEAIQHSLERDLPPLLLTPLSSFEQERPDFYQQSVIPLLISRMNGSNQASFDENVGK